MLVFPTNIWNFCCIMYSKVCYFSNSQSVCSHNTILIFFGETLCSLQPFVVMTANTEAKSSKIFFIFEFIQFLKKRICFIKGKTIFLSFLIADGINLIFY